MKRRRISDEWEFFVRVGVREDPTCTKRRRGDVFSNHGQWAFFNEVFRLSVLSHIEAVARRTLLDGSETMGIKRSLDTLEVRIDLYFKAELIKEHFAFGSFTRGTLMPRSMDAYSDVDYMVVFQGVNYKPATYLKWLKDFAESRYSSSIIGQSAPAVRLDLNHIRFELVPAINTSYGLQIPGPAKGYQEWITTDPNGFKLRLNDVNAGRYYLVKPMLRVLKYWNARAGYPFPSYPLEEMATGSDFYFCSNLKDVFFKAVLQLRTSYADTAFRRNAVERAQAIVMETQSLEAQNCPALAEAEIKKLIP